MSRAGAARRADDRCWWPATRRPPRSSPGRSSGSRAPRDVLRPAGRRGRRRRRRRLPHGHDQRDAAPPAGAPQRRAAAGEAADRDRRIRPTRRASCCVANAYLVHHDPAIYPDPYAFRPERFLDEPPGTYTWIPFGGGRRRCLGASFALLEMKIVLRAVARRFTIDPGGQRREQTGRRGITFSPSGGATVVLHPRPPAERRRRSRGETGPPASRLERIFIGPGRVSTARGSPPSGPSLRPLSRHKVAAIPMAVDQEVRQRPGRQPGGARRLLRVLLDVPAAARVHHDPRVRAAGRPDMPRVESRTRCSPSSRSSAPDQRTHR